MSRCRPVSRWMMFLLVCAGLLAAGWAYAIAAPPVRPAAARPAAASGALDPTFGAAGRVTTTLGSGSRLTALVLQPDAKIVAAGNAGAGVTGTMTLARYLLDGRLDPTFGSGGTINTSFFGIADWANAVTLQPDAKLVAAGVAAIGDTQYYYTTTFGLARYLPDGQLDPSFGSGGKVSTHFATSSRDSAAAVAVAPDGTLVAAGETEEGETCSWAVARYTPGGVLDPRFAGTGIVTGTLAAACGSSQAVGVAVQPDGQILVAGTGEGGPLAVARFRPDGTLDPGFGFGGRATAGFGGAQGEADALALAPDGAIIVAGQVITASQTQFAVARFRPDGTLDPAFGSGGQAYATLTPDRSEAYALQLDAAGGVLVAGRATHPGLTPPDYDFGLLRFLPNGQVDPTFGAGGVQTTFAPEDAYARALLIQPDGKLVAGGPAANSENGTAYFALARYLGGPGPAPTPPPPTATPPGGPGCLFRDVCPADYFYPAVAYLVAHGALSGYADGTFRPYNTTTRGQLAKIVVGAEGWPLVTAGRPHFADVPPADPFYPYIETAYAHGVIAGYADGTFRPAAAVTRVQVAKIVVAAQGWPLVAPARPHFTDVPPANPFYAVVETAVAHSILSGYADGTFRPGANATRGQISKIVYGAVTGP